MRDESPAMKVTFASEAVSKRMSASENSETSMEEREELQTVSLEEKNFEKTWFQKSNLLSHPESNTLSQ